MSPRTPLPAEDLEELEEEPTDVTSAPSVREGALVDGRYRVLRELGRGGMSVVYLAEHVELGRQVALKILRPPRAGKGLVDFGTWFKREARTLAGIQHPNVVTLHDFGRVDDEDFFLVMEYVDGPSLARILRQHGPLEPREALQLFVQVCRALRHTHRRGVVHLDVKPSNLLVTADLDGTPLVKVIDFGLAEGGGVVAVEDDVLAGSPHCMAPEQIEGRPTGPATDLYALGVVMYRTITGRWPFHGPTPRETLLAHLVQQPPALADAAPGIVVPDGLEELLRRCLARDPADRFPDAASLLAELARVLDVDGSDIDSQSLQSPAVPQPPPAPGPPAPPVPEAVPDEAPAARRAPVGAIVAAVAVAVLVGAAAWFAAGAPPEEVASASTPLTAPEAPLTAEPPARPPAPVTEPVTEHAAAPSAAGGSADDPEPSARPEAEPAPTRSAPKSTRSSPRAPSGRSPPPREAPADPSPTPPKGYKAMPDF